MIRKACVLFTWMVCLSISMSGVLLANQPEVTELIVRFKPGVGMVESLDEVIRSVNDGKHEALKKRLSNPIGVRPFLNSYNRSSRKPKTLAKVIKKSPKEILDEYIVLSYTDNKALRNAKEILKKDDGVLWFGENSNVMLSAVPNDPLNGAVVVGPVGESDYQWALYALNMHEAWDYSKGHAYVSMVDFGIQTDHPDILDNFRDQFSARIISYQKSDPDGFPEYNIVHLFNSSHDVDEVSVLKSADNLYEYNDSQIRAGHGMHVAGIMAAKQNNGIGISGICGDCSLMTNHTGRALEDPGSIFGDPRKLYTGMSTESLANNIIWLTDTGAQLINMSLGGTPHPSYAPENGCSGRTEVGNTWILNAELYPMCIAIHNADVFDVVVVAAAGNKGATSIEFPASDPRVIAVGAVNKNGDKPDWSNTGPELDLVAPGVNILSTFYTDKIWLKDDGNEATFTPYCGDEFSALSGYGPCSGTSMATPHVTGIAAILRSINPLLNKRQIKDLLTEYASQEGVYNDQVGYGMPDAAASIKAAMGTVNGEVLQNRLTPLFSLYSSDAEDHLYTTVPQMAMAAIYNFLRPQPGTSHFEMPDDPVLWRSIGSRTSGYNSFPYITWMPSEPPKASVYIFTTNDNPLDPAEPDGENEDIGLIPLYRLSYQIAKGGNTRNIDHTYATSQAEIDFFTNSDRGYKLDGIEGYIYPRSMPTQPEGTVKLYRKYNPARDDHAIFPESELSIMMAQGYTEDVDNDWIGYVYPNQDSDSDYLIDGFETIIGTDVFDPDSDDDGISDGSEIITYPYSDPLDLIATPVVVQMTPDEVTSSWYSLNYLDAFSEMPVLLSQMQTFDGADTASIRMRMLTSQGVGLRIEEEASRDTETGHTTEVVGLLGVAPGEISDSTGRVIGEAGFVTANTSGNSDWRSLAFNGSYVNPVVIMNMVTQNGSNASHIRLRNVTADNVEFQIEEWDYLDQFHATETMAYVVLEQGEFTLAENRQLRVGMTTTSHVWQQVDFLDTGDMPAVFTQSQTYVGGQAVVTRQRNASSSGFAVRLQEEEANGAHAIESIGYIAIQQD